MSQTSIPSSNFHPHLHHNQSLNNIPTLSCLQQTLQQIQSRVQFFSSHNLSAENGLMPNNNQTLRSISEIITPLKYFHMGETPLNLNLASIYLNQQNRHQIKWAIPPASEGQDSINQQELFQPSFKWLTSSMVDSHMLELDSIEPKKVQRGKIAEQWKGITQIILVNVKQNIYLKSQIKQIQNIVRRKFQRYSWLKFKRAKQIYFRGKKSVILKFNDQNSASFVYFNLLSWKSNREEFGDDCEEQPQGLQPVKELGHYDIQTITFKHDKRTINKYNRIIWIVQIAGYKYGICRVSYLDEALMICSMFNNKKIRQSKVNIHPKSSKNWKAQQITMNLTSQQEII